jgi:hypothetical protein
VNDQNNAEKDTKKEPEAEDMDVDDEDSPGDTDDAAGADMSKRSSDMPKERATFERQPTTSAFHSIMWNGGCNELVALVNDGEFKHRSVVNTVGAVWSGMFASKAKWSRLDSPRKYYELLDGLLDDKRRQVVTEEEMLDVVCVSILFFVDSVCQLSELRDLALRYVDLILRLLEASVPDFSAHMEWWWTKLNKTCGFGSVNFGDLAKGADVTSVMQSFVDDEDPSEGEQALASVWVT